MTSPASRTTAFSQTSKLQGLSDQTSFYPNNARPLYNLTVGLVETYKAINTAFQYNTDNNPRRVLTKPSEPAGNYGRDNVEHEYILYVNEHLGPTNYPKKYQIIDLLGKGTFGQVVKCHYAEKDEYVAVKVIKNQDAFYHQGLMEVAILNKLSESIEHEGSHVVRLIDHFIFKNHLCIAFDLLDISLYDLIKQNNHKGLTIKLVARFIRQILVALTSLYELGIIHCDLKPENVLLEDTARASLRVIDFGSACFQNSTTYNYIQSRFYRSPEVILGLPYALPIDVWSLGCMAFELFYGLPLFPGLNQQRMITRFIRFLGPPPVQMIQQGKQSANFFHKVNDTGTLDDFRTKSDEEYAKLMGEKTANEKEYFKYDNIRAIVMGVDAKPGIDVSDELMRREALLSFLSVTLCWDPSERWTPAELLQHPFVTGVIFDTQSPLMRPTGHYQSQLKSKRPQFATPSSLRTDTSVLGTSPSVNLMRMSNSPQPGSIRQRTPTSGSKRTPSGMLMDDDDRIRNQKPRKRLSAENRHNDSGTSRRRAISYSEDPNHRAQYTANTYLQNYQYTSPTHGQHGQPIFTTSPTYYPPQSPGNGYGQYPGGWRANNGFANQFAMDEDTHVPPPPLYTSDSKIPRGYNNTQSYPQPYPEESGMYTDDMVMGRMDEEVLEEPPRYTGPSSYHQEWTDEFEKPMPPQSYQGYTGSSSIMIQPPHGQPQSYDDYQRHGGMHDDGFLGLGTTPQYGQVNPNYTNYSYPHSYGSYVGVSGPESYSQYRYTQPVNLGTTPGGPHDIFVPGSHGTTYYSQHQSSQQRTQWNPGGN